MNRLQNVYLIQIIRTLSFVLSFFLFPNASTLAQDSAPPPEYFKNIEIADSLFDKQHYKEAIAYYRKALQAFGGKAYPDDRYKLARAWGLSGNTDSLFFSLNHLCSRARYWNYQRFIDDPAFNLLKNTPKFDQVVDCFKENKQKYYPEINVEFYNALDSMYLEGERTRKQLALAALDKEKVLLLNEQIRKKDSINLTRVTALLDKYGWPDAAAIEFYGNYTLFSIIRQSPRSGYEKYHRMMDEANLKATPTLNVALMAKLDSIRINDQLDRVNMKEVQQTYGPHSKQIDSLWKKIAYKDSINLIAVKQIIGLYGWPGPDIAGHEGSQTVFLVIQHADLATQERYLPIMREAVKKGKALASDLALLEDRVLTRNGKPQIYGSQLQENHTTGKYEFAPIQDAANVNKLRASVGLPPLEDYAKMMGINYKQGK